MILNPEPVTRRRYQETVGADGRTEKALESEEEVSASVQPLSDRQRMALPEGVRQSVDRRLYTTAHFRTADQKTGEPADAVRIRGEDYLVVQVKYWSGPFEHYEVDVQRIAEADDASWSP